MNTIYTLYESILTDIEDTLVNGDNTLKFGNNFVLKDIYGDDDLLLAISRGPLKKVAANLEYDSNDSANVKNIVDTFESKFCAFTGLGNAKRNILYDIIKVIENVQIPVGKDFNNKNVKNNIIKVLNDTFKNLNILSNNVLLHNDSKMGGDAKGVFQLIFEYKYNTFVLLYEIK